MDLSKTIRSVQILNVNHDVSTISADDLLLCNPDPNPRSFIVSDADEELLIMMKFNDFIDIQSIKMYALPLDDVMDIEDASAPKQIHIYKLSNLNHDFEDIKKLKPHKSMVCSSKKLSKGQTVNLRKNISKPLAFQKVKYLAIFIESNQNDTEYTYLYGISLKNRSNDREQQQPNECEAAFEIIDELLTMQDDTTCVRTESSMNQIYQHLTDLWDIDESERQKGIKLLQQICSNILADPSNLKFRDLNFAIIGEQCDECQPALLLLFDAGFTLSEDGQRLILKSNELNIVMIRIIFESLSDETMVFPIDYTLHFNLCHWNHPFLIVFRSECNTKSTVPPIVNDEI